MDLAVTLGFNEVNETSCALNQTDQKLPFDVRGRRWIVPILAAKDVSVIAVIFGTIINSCGFIGNIAIIGGIITSPRLRKAYNVFIGSLAVNDFLSIVFANMFQMISYGKRTWIFNYPLCVFNHFAFTQFHLSTVLHILAITIFRYVIIVHPAAGKRLSTKTTVISMVAFLYVLPILILVLPKIRHMNEYFFFPPLALCLAGLQQPGIPSVLFFASFGSVAVLSLLFTHLRIHHVIRKTESRLHQNDLPSVGSSGIKTTRQKKHIRVLKCMLAVFVLFSASYFPGVAIIMNSSTLHPYRMMMAMCLPWLSTGTNWIIYGVLDRDFRDAYKRLLLLCRSGGRVRPASVQNSGGTLNKNTKSTVVLTHMRVNRGLQMDV